MSKSYKNKAFKPKEKPFKTQKKSKVSLKSKVMSGMYDDENQY